jgi:hypothetical protein
MTKMTNMLEVHQCLMEDTYHDHVRIPVAHRGAIKDGSICNVKGNGKTLITEVRDLDETRAVIRIGEKQRRCLCVELLKTYEFEITEVSWLKQFRWAWNTPRSASRIAARLGLLSAILGLIGILIALISLVAYTSN